MLTTSEVEEIRGQKFEKYDNFDAIEIPKVKWIPSDYEGVMGVPVTFIGKHNRDQFELLGRTKHKSSKELYLGETPVPSIAKLKGKELFYRLFIKHKTK